MKTSYWSRLRVLTWAVLFAAGSLASCSDDDDKGGPTPPPVQLVDQIEYDGGTPIDIKSAIFEVEDTDLYTFYLSPTAGIADMDGMSEANDYLRVMVRNPKGTVNTESDTFEISYKDISIKEATMKDVKSVKLSADYLSETSRLNLYVEVEMESGKTLLARYENTCSEAKLPELNNQYELNGEALTIGSVLKWTNAATGVTTYYFYNEADVTEPQDGLNGLTVTLAAEATETTFDLSTIDPAQVSVKYGAFQNTENTTGSLNIEVKNNVLTLAIDAEEGDNHLRAAYSGAFTFGFESQNYIKVTKSETPEEAALAKVFVYKKGSTNILTFGMVDAEAPANLMEGNYAASISLTETQLKECSIDLSEKDPIFQKPLAQIQIFDYLEYRIWDNSTYAEVNGTLTTRQEGNTTYLKLVVEYKDGVTLESEWSGVLTTTSEETDMTPVKPFHPHITITKEDGSPTDLDWDITELQMRHDPNYSDMGETSPSYIFYFVNANTEQNGGVDNTTGTPVLIIPDQETSYNIPNLKETGDTFKWSFQFNNRNLSLYSLGYGYNNSWMKRCPEEGSIQIEKVDKNWKITFRFKDLIDKGFAKEGTSNTLVVEWEGPATKYSGTKPNDLTDEDY